ncbi:serine hydrolase [Mucilaginibacter sp.]|uniref:serine hydrolase domain-containing protein n=1 Tax=Mucilaginibacter sp. TaxID=1882438 RepID=UPI002609E7A4|nr:serine hydrolase [Mucilaginibacter sp.]MDB5030555.1 Beta-lactamase [Mucilaginibacter sp.]
MKNLLVILFVCGVTAGLAQNHAINQQKLSKIREAEQSAVVLNNNTGFIPLKEVQGLKVASVHAGYSFASVFDSIANKYSHVTGFNVNDVETTQAYNALHDKLKLYNLILFTISNSTKFTPACLGFVKDMESLNKVIFIITGDGKNLNYLNNTKSPVIYCKNNTSEGASIAAQLIFGGVAAKGKLTATYTSNFTIGAGYQTQKIRLGYSIPEAVAVNSDLLAGIDSLVAAGIATHAAPSVVVLLAKDGEVIFHKAYGKHTYDGSEITKPDDLFDMASVTKVTATTPSIMRLYDRKVINLDSPISKYVALVRDAPDKRDVKIKEALLHEAGFTPYIKFYEQLKPSDMSRDSSAAYPTKVADNYYLRANYFDEVMWPVTLKSEGHTRGKFVYSDLSMYMMKEVVEEVSHTKLNDFAANEFYLPLGLQVTGFMPRNRFAKSRIVPTTENDNWFRNMLVQGYVNDPGSAMAGGVEGHAGLFANANDLAIFYQMLLNEGVYGGKNYYKPGTVKMFTSRQSKVSQRGYGYDRVSNDKQPGDYRSEQAFGHSGYTGTYVWVDPKYNLVFIFLSNRTYPDDGKTFGVSKVNLRPRILDMYYNAIVNSKAVGKN